MGPAHAKRRRPPSVRDVPMHILRPALSRRSGFIASPFSDLQGQIGSGSNYFLGYSVVLAEGFVATVINPFARRYPRATFQLLAGQPKQGLPERFAQHRIASDLLRQSGLAQAFDVFGVVFRSTKCSNAFLEVGNTYVGIELEGSGDGFPRFFKPSGESVADCSDSQRDHGIWSLPQRLFGPFHRLGIAAGVEMGECRHALHRKHEGIERAQVHGARQVLYRRIWLTTARSPHLSAGVPCGGQVRIESEGPVDDGSGSLEIADDVMKRKPCKSERDRSEERRVGKE